MAEYELTSAALYDIVETYPDCTVQVLRNSVTGEESIGWWCNDAPPVELGVEE